jgi:hypothetical protein
MKYHNYFNATYFVGLLSNLKILRIILSEGGIGLIGVKFIFATRHENAT